MSASAVVLMLFPVPHLRAWELAFPITNVLLLVSLGVFAWDLVVWEFRLPKRRQAPRLPGEAPSGRAPNL